MEKNEEKKVEYLELIYDLIFVYLIGRNNSLIHVLKNGFIDGQMYVMYAVCTLAVIQVWSYSSFYINRYGRNGLRDHISVFINMYLLYYMAEGISVGWKQYFDQYHFAWALILFNLGFQYWLERRNHRNAPWELQQIDRSIWIIWLEAVLVAAAIPVYHFTGFYLTIIAIIFGILGTAFSGQISILVPVDFEHLTERIMLYVVFTFGEMIIGISSYFQNGFSINTLYFSGMAFLIVTGLFLSYGILYDYVIDREKVTNGTGYMMIHVFVIFALNNITAALELMREEKADLFPKLLFLTGSFLLYFFLMFLLEMYAKKVCRPDRRFLLTVVGMAVSFFVLMMIFRHFMYLNIFISVLYVFAVFFYFFYRLKKRRLTR